ncbi:lipoyl(octanoyl) transferase LipB [Volucribacter amazonae]|uniref:Octanoyltransferase n=1 Tax=Volucribacter amazonae TaxID=256731 RepID=A0A9X4PIB6_9PAST|nr:lipoyl(octanoyl) transferase LipB [Volucribacter amazonae]MDG6895765.1 octanoyltransferase [Volucribacter amazonae]
MNKIEQQDKQAKRIIVRQLGQQDYQSIWQKMQDFTDQRQADTADEIWLVEHFPVFTQGQTGKAEHLLRHSEIPVVQSDRGGQITYHGLGQQIMYILIDIKRKKQRNLAPHSTAEQAPLTVRQLVSTLEQTVIQTLADYGVESYAKADAPGVYVNEQKICSLGLRIRRGCSFHGLALNINMDLTPFLNINPCGYAGLEMCQLATLIDEPSLRCEPVASKLVQHFCQLLDYQEIQYKEGF